MEQDSKPTPFIRPYEPKDFKATAHICTATLPPSLASSQPAQSLAPYLWTHQYTHLSPRTCFVLDSGTGEAVGYVIGCPSVPSFVAAYPEYVSSILSRDVPAPKHTLAEKKEDWCLPGSTEVNPECLKQTAYDPHLLLLESEAKKALVEKFGATMHIDLLEPFQRQGWGRKLIERFLRTVKEEGAKGGVHIGIAGENSKVVLFYEKVGFKVVPGGEATSTIWMVKEFE